MLKRTKLRDVYRFAGFRTRATLTPHPKDHDAYVIRLERRHKCDLLGLRHDDFKLLRPAATPGA
jgi:hypothetical protein